MSVGTSNYYLYACFRRDLRKGYRWAANLLVYPQGDWYGTVSQSDVPHLLDSVLEIKHSNGDQVNQFWRGRMGLTTKEQKDLANKIQLND